MKLIKFYTDSCGPCKVMKPILETFLNSHPELDYEEFNCGDGIPDDYAQVVRSVPTFIIVKEDSPNKILRGLHTLEQLEKEVYG